jgi:hypothetical protein
LSKDSGRSVYSDSIRIASRAVKCPSLIYRWDYRRPGMTGSHPPVILPSPDRRIQSVPPPTLQTHVVLIMVSREGLKTLGTLQECSCYIPPHPGVDVLMPQGYGFKFRGYQLKRSLSEGFATTGSQ